MEDDATPSESVVDEPSRPFKRRKFYRKRVETSFDNETGTAEDPLSSNVPHLNTSDDPPNPSVTQSEGEENADGDPSLSISEIFRRRKAAQKKRGGIEFSNSTSIPEGSALEARLGDEILDSEDSFGKILTVVDRFAPQTGQVVDVDKHMYAITQILPNQTEDADTDVVRMAYIDAELVKRHQGHQQAAHTSNSHDLNGESLNLPADLAKHRQPAALGKLHEIDLGVDATLRNIARTEAAKKRLEGGEPEVEETTGKVRLRRDGKPWRGRRRNSDDVKRDKLVEEVMKESRRKLLTTYAASYLAHILAVEIYDELEADIPNDDQAADDRIAEQFRREFMDAVSSRRQKTAQTTKKGPGAKVDDKPKGPKLGGSRSARAAMRELQEKSAKK
ncbi:MAG: hypothetical protein L6R41_008150 [Letrouitia leprolyta]|nr:MAG: hypothetical protein L6R41_008150 [Letrouitia leprolyta]